MGDIAQALNLRGSRANRGCESTLTHIHGLFEVAPLSQPLQLGIQFTSYVRLHLPSNNPCKFSQPTNLGGRERRGSCFSTLLAAVLRRPAS
jgi:hypothetical protein